MGATFVIITVVSVLVTLGIVLAVVFMIRGAGGDKKVLATGTPGTAQIVSVAPTGMIINDLYYQCQIGLRVQLPGEAPYDVYTKDLIAITSMAMVTPGSTVAVKVDPENRSKVAVDWQAGITPAGAAAVANPNPTAGEIAAAMAAGGAQGVQTGSAADLLRTGQRVAGVLTEFADTGNTARSLGLQPSRPEFIDDPMYALTLQLRIPNVAPVEAKVIQRVPRALVPTLAMGAQYNCAVNPANPTREVAVDWGDIPV